MTAATNRLTFSPHWPDTHGGPTDKSVSSNWQIDSLCQLLTNPVDRKIAFSAYGGVEKAFC